MRFALVRHDAAIAAALARQAIKRWRDLLTILVLLPILALFARAWLAGLPVERRQIILGIASFLIATALAKALSERVTYHRTDGALAHLAQRTPDAMGYVMSLLAAGLAVLLVGLLAIGGLTSPRLALWIGAGLALGLMVTVFKERVATSNIRLLPGAGRVFQNRHRLVVATALSAIVGMVCALLPSENHLDAIVAGGWAALAVILTGQVDAATVRYLAMVGNSSRDMLRKWLPLQIALLVPAAAALAIAQSWVAASVAAIAAVGLPAVTMLRMFAYRALSRVLADWLVIILIAIAAYLTVSLPPLGPLAIVAAILWLAHRGRDTRWLIL